MSSYYQTRELILNEFDTNPKTGLTEAEVTNRLDKYGKNALKEKKKRTIVQKFLDQFKDVMILILIAAAVISFAVAVMERDSSAFFEPFLIILIVVINAVMGVFQENKAEKSLEALQKMAAPHARVIREGIEKVVESSDIVPGDIIKLEAGDFVPADARLITSFSLKSEEAALTGESVPAEKDAETVVLNNAPIGDRFNMIYSGCSIVYGTGTAVVTQTGMDTEMGKIANLLDAEEDTQTPLQLKLAQLGKYMGMLALVICGIIFIMGVLNGIPVIEIFMTAVSLAVSAIPEGLPVIVTIVLSIGVERMAKQNAIVKRLPAVETLGCTSVICSDKTGTLTQNKMTLVKAYLDENGVLEEISAHNSDAVKELLKYGTLCSNGSVTYTSDKETHIGDPTETSIIAAAYKNGMAQDTLTTLYARMGELPFDSDRKLMSTIQMMNGKCIVITKGAFDCLMPRCISGNIEKATQVTHDLSKEALRVLAVAYKEISSIPTVLKSEDLEKDLIFMGLVGMIDPPREEAKQAVDVCKKAGIRPIMITGDHVITASAIARQLGILNDGEEAITGTDLSEMTDSEFDAKIRNISVYARVSPQDKIRVIKAWQRKNEIVSMTGDGVNDAPALKAADIGCAMGITGTDVAKGAADMTLQDDNFATIVSAVKEGRGIYNNIRKSVAFLLGTNIGEVLLVFISMLLWKISPLLPMQLLWINLVTDSMPAIALGMEPVEASVMNVKPRPKNEGIFAHGLGIQVIFQGIMFGCLALIAFKIAWDATGSIEGGRTLTFMVMSLTQIIHSFNMRSSKSLFKTGVFTNSKLNKAALISVVLVLFVLFIPQVALIFGLTILPANLYFIGLALSFSPVVVLELSKAVGIVK